MINTGRGFVSLAGVLAAMLITVDAGCAYRLHPPSPPFQQRLRVIADAPDTYVIRVQAKAYAVPADGHVTFTMALPRQACSVYLFDKIPIRRPPNPTTQKALSIVFGGSAVRRLSMRDIAALPKDADGVPQVRVPVASGSFR